VVCVQHPLSDDLMDDGTVVVKVKDYKKNFDPFLRNPKGISTVRGLQFKRGQSPSCRYSMTGACHTPVCYLKNGMKVKSLVNPIDPILLRDAYATFLPIKYAKLSDVNYLLAHLAGLDIGERFDSLLCFLSL